MEAAHGADCGHYMNDIPTVFVSLENPYHLQDFPRVKTYINCYSNNDHCLHQLIENSPAAAPSRATAPWMPSAASGTRTCKSVRK